MVEETLCTIQERIQEVLDARSRLEIDNRTEIQKSVEIFKDKHEYNSFSDIKLCKALETSLDKILIDTSFHRNLNFVWVLRLLQKFEALEVRPLMVYECTDNSGHYVAFDGQHTAVLLYVLVTEVFKENLEGCIIPIIKYDASQVKEQQAVLLGSTT